MSGSFFNNRAGESGGAISLANIIDPSREVSISGVTFENNLAHRAQGGAILFSNIYSSTIVNCTFRGNNGTTGGGAVMISSRRAAGMTQVSDSHFVSNRVPEKFEDIASALQISNAATELLRVTVSASLFRDNVGGPSVFGFSVMLNLTRSIFEANTEGAYGSDRSLDIIEDCQFVSNRAKLGAALNLQRPVAAPLAICNLFRNNAAAFAGGVVYWQGIHPSFEDNAFVNNSVGEGWGPRNATAPAYIRVLFHGNEQSRLYVSPGAKFSVTVLIYDLLQQLVAGSEADINILLSSRDANVRLSSSIRENTLPLAVDGKNQFNGLSLSSGTQWASTTFDITVKVGELYHSSDLHYEKNVTLIPCPPGYSQDGCVQCPDNFYSWGDACLPCPIKGCARVVDQALIIEHVVPVPSFTSPEKLIACQNPENCHQVKCIQKCSLSDRSCNPTCSPTNGNCSDGFDGFMCSHCRCDTEACYYPSFEECLLCPDSGAYDAKSLAVLIVGVFVGLLLFLAITSLPQSGKVLVVELVLFIILLALGLTQQWLLQLLFIVEVGAVFVLHDVSREGMVKILLFYVQMMSSIIAPRLWGSWAQNVMSVLRIADVKMVSLRCINPFFENEIANFVGILVVPLVLIGLIVCVLFVRKLLAQRIASCCRRKNVSDEDGQVARRLLDLGANDDDDSEGTEEAADTHIHPEIPFKTAVSRTIVFVFYTSHFALTEQIVNIFHCKTYQNGVAGTASYLIEKPWIPCSFQDFEYSILFALAVIFFVLYALGVPVVLTYFLRKHRVAISTDEPVPWLSFVYQSFQSRYFWFEIIFIIRRLLLSVSFSIFARDNPFQQLCITSILTLSLALQYHIQPFLSPIENYFEVIATGLLLVSFASSNAVVGANACSGDDSPLQCGFRGTLAVINVVFVIISLCVILYPLAKRLRRKIKNR